VYNDLWETIDFVLLISHSLEIGSGGVFHAIESVVSQGVVPSVNFSFD
jgi:hypothetical protein